MKKTFSAISDWFYTVWLKLGFIMTIIRYDIVFFARVRKNNSDISFETFQLGHHVEMVAVLQLSLQDAIRNVNAERDRIRAERLITETEGSINARK
jgi:hypothetical protein